MENEWAGLLWAEAWQVTLLILAVAVLSRWVGRNHPHFAHALWVVVLLKAVTPPIWSSPSGVFSWLQSPVAQEEPQPIAEPLAPEPPPPKPVSRFAPLLEADLAAEDVEWPEPQMVSPERTGALPPIVGEAEPVIENPAPPARPASVAVAAPEEAPRWPLWQIIGFAFWLCGMLGSLLIAGARWMSCRREIRRTEIVDDPAAQQLLEELTTRLRVRRKVRLVISRSRIGPAVLGVFRPTVLIPARILEGQSKPADLEPILAHELIHVRRGDLWVGWLQVLAQSVWWFHPLVWWAGRLVKREAERCCDEEVIAELGMKPARYARALLDVLELKHILKPVPVLPGVKPVEITSNRLERIMLLRHGCRKRTPWWCWLVMLLTAALTLPGAAFVAQAKERNKTKRHAKNEKKEKSTAPVERHYKISDLLKRIQTDYELPSEAAARESLEVFLKAAAYRTGKFNDSTISIEGKRLTVTDTPSVQREIAKNLKHLRKYGFREVKVEPWIVSINPDVLNSAISRWKTLSSAAPKNGPDSDQSLESGFSKATEAENRVEMIVEKSVPLRLAILNEAERGNLIETCQRDPRTNILMSPKVQLSNGRVGTILNITQRPFVVGLSKDGKPAVRVVSEGLRMKVRPVLGDNDQIRLESEMTFSEIRDVATVTLPGHANSEKPAKVQVPEVATTRVKTTLDVANGSTLLIGGLKSPEGKAQHGEQLFVAIKVTRVNPRPAEPPKPIAIGQGASTGIGLVESVEMLMVESGLIPLWHKADPKAKGKPPAKQAPAQAATDVEVRYAKKAAELADLEYQKALEANRRVKGAVSDLEIERLRLAVERAHLQVKQAELDLAKQQFGKMYQANPAGWNLGFQMSMPIGFRAAEAQVRNLELQLAKARAALAKQPTGKLMFGAGVNSEAGVVGNMKLNEQNLDTAKIEPPTKEEVLKELPESALENVDPKSIEIKTERVKDTTGESRFYPMVGPARLRTVRFKCTVSTTEQIRNASFVPETRHQKYVLYIDRSHLIRAAGPTAADGKSSEIEDRFWESLRTKRQFTNERGHWSITVADVRGKTLVKPTVKFTSPGGKAHSTEYTLDQAATGTVEFDLKNNQLILHLVQGHVEIPGKRHVWFEKEDKPLPLPQAADATDGQPIPPAPAVLPAGHSVAYDLKDLPAPSASKQTPNEKTAALQELLDEYNTLFKQQRYAEAEVLAKKAREDFPDDSTIVAMFWKARLRGGRC